MEKKVKFIQKLQNFSNEITQSVTSKAEYLEKLENELNQLFLIQKESPEQVLEDYFEKFNKNDWKIFWLSYQHVIEYLISNLIQNNDLNDDNNNNNHNNSLEKQKYCQKLYEFCSFLLQNYQEIKIKTDSFYNIMELLHNILLILLPINNNEKNIQKLKECKLLISRLCEKLWFDQDTNANRYITQLIPYLLLHALDSTSHESDIKRIYHLKDTFNEFDYEDSSIDTIRGLLLRCFVDVKFLKVAEGRRFLSYVFTLHENLHSLIIGVMKPQLATGLHSVSTAYGDILYRAYRELSDQSSTSTTSASSSSSSSQQLLHSLEEHLQDLGYTTIHSQNKKYFNNLKNCLNIFHQNKNIKGIDGLLLKIYGPFIWRTLKSSNPLVRTQSCIIFMTIFPLYNSNDIINQIELDNILQKQFNMILLLLKDQDHRVRAVSCIGVCHILKEFWEVIPSQSTHQILSYLIGTLGFDSSDAQIRCNVLIGLQELLRNPLSHVALRGLLPILTNLLHDYSDKVRLAFIQLLNKVKIIRGFKFYDIVSIDRLCDQLNRDANKPTLCLEMTQLLLNSFYPRPEYQDNDDEDNNEIIDYSREQIKRCLSFIHSYESAALVFYGNLYKHTSIGSAIKVCVMLWNVLITQNTSNNKKNENEEEDDNNEKKRNKKKNQEEEEEEEEEENNEDENENFNNKNKRNLKNNNKSNGKSKSKSGNNDSLTRMKRGREVTSKNSNNSSSSATTSALTFKPELSYEILLIMEAILKPLQKKLTEPSYQPSKALLQEHIRSSSIHAVYDRLKDLKLLCDVEKKVEESITCHIAMSSLLEISGILLALEGSTPSPPPQSKKKGSKALSSSSSSSSSSSLLAIPCEDILSSYYEEEEEGHIHGTNESFRIALLNSIINQIPVNDNLENIPFWILIHKEFHNFMNYLHTTSTSSTNTGTSKKGKNNIFNFYHFEKTLHLLYTFFDSNSLSPSTIEYRRNLIIQPSSYEFIKQLLQQSINTIGVSFMDDDSKRHVSSSYALIGYLWTIVSLQKDILTSQSKPQTQTTPSPEINDVFQWVYNDIIPNIHKSMNELTFGSILSPIVDSLTLEENESSQYILTTLNQWAIQLLKDHNFHTFPLQSTLPSITRLLTILTSPALKVTLTSKDTTLYEIQSTIQSTWYNYMDILLLHLFLPEIQSIIISYLKFKEFKNPTRFQILLLNKIITCVMESITVIRDFEWKPLLEIKSDLTEEKLQEGIQWKENNISGSICAEILMNIATSSQSFDLILSTLLHSFSSIKDESSRIGLSIFLRRLLKSSNMKELPSSLHDKLDNHHDVMELLQQL